MKPLNICLSTQSQTVWWNIQQALCKVCIVRTLSTTGFYHQMNTSNISANMSYPGASSGFKIWKNWHQDSSGLIAASCLILDLSDQMCIQNSIVATLLMGKMGTFISYWHEYLVLYSQRRTDRKDQVGQRSQSLAPSIDLMVIPLIIWAV